MRWLIGLAALIVFGSVATAAEKTPRIIECAPESVILHPSGLPVTWAELRSPSNAVVQLLDEVTTNKANQHLVVFVRPGAVKIYRMVRRLIGQRTLDVTFELADKGAPLALPAKPSQPQENTGKTAAFFECRMNQLFFVDLASIYRNVERAFAAAKKFRFNTPEFFQELSKQEFGDKYYRVLPHLLVTAVVALELKPDVNGDAMDRLRQADSDFATTLTKLDTQKQYIVFLVRDDSIPSFQSAREIAEKCHFDTGWELIGLEEPIKFGPPPRVFE